MTSKIDLSITIRELEIKGHATAKYAKIRSHARWLAARHNLLKSCQKCGYSKHVEVAHIKAIKDFADTATLAEVNSFDNLLILCPNCHWEFDYEKRSNGRSVYCECGKSKKLKSIYCWNCYQKRRINQYTKINWPDPKEILLFLEHDSYCALGRKLGVSDNAIRKYLDKHIGYHPR